jgi:hypothetical protein
MSQNSSQVNRAAEACYSTSTSGDEEKLVSYAPKSIQLKRAKIADNQPWYSSLLYFAVIVHQRGEH